ncbi:MAG: glycosyltransferase [Alteromonadaceae bacterium]|nr:glycosyltransferase [Alteromonadaceae bacterium]
MSRPDPLFTIVTVTWNNLSGLKVTAASIAVQRFVNFEWLVVDGASKDGTPDWLANCTTPGLTWISEPDNGLYDAMNKAIASARGRYLIFMNAGDEFADIEVLRRTADEVARDPADILYGQSYEVADGQRLLKTAFPHDRIWYSMFTHHQAIFYAREAIGERRYSDNLKIAGDWALTAEIYKAGKSFRPLGYPVCIFERGGVSQSNDPKVIAKIYAERDWVNRNILGMNPLKSRAILFVKHGVEHIRHKYPEFYDQLRFRRS